MLKDANAPITSQELEQLAKGAIQALLANVPGLNAEIIDHTGRQEWDFEVLLNSDQGPQKLLCEVKSRAWPNELHGIGHRLFAAINTGVPGPTIPVFIAPYLSPQARETCNELGLSWADLAGNCEIKIQGAYLKVHGMLNPYQRGRGTATLYSPKSSVVVHALLLEHPRSWTVEELAKVSGVSLGQIASVKKLLEINHWLRSSYGETVLTEPRKLLDDWTLHYKPKRNEIKLFTLDPPALFEDRVTSSLTEYAFTEFSAAQRYAPYTKHQRMALYVRTWREADSQLLGLKRGDGASNVTVYETGEPLTMLEEVRGSRCVSPVLTYLDLKMLSGRGQDAAEHLLESVIEPRWR